MLFLTKVDGSVNKGEEERTKSKELSHQMALMETMLTINCSIKLNPKCKKVFIETFCTNE